MVSLKSQAEADLKAFEDHVAQLPEVRECHMLNGEIDFILKVVAKDLQSFQQFLTSQLTPALNVASVKTSLTIRTSRNLPRSEEHTSELQSLMRISYAVFCLKQKIHDNLTHHNTQKHTSIHQYQQQI